MTAWRRYAEPFKKVEPDQSGWHPLDGHTVYAALVDEDPDDDFLNDQPTDLSPPE